MFLLLIIINYIVMFLIVLIFFQSHAKTVDLRNLTLFHHFDLFELFISLLSGVVLFFKRILWINCIVVLHILRLDVPLTPKGWEGYDSGFSAYAGFLVVDEYYSHPVLLTFAYFLLRPAQ